MPRDKSWVLLDDRRLEPYRKGCLEFLEHAFKYAAIEDRIRCPCRDCRNKKFGNYEFVHSHLLWRGMCKRYGQGLWTSHNECEDHCHGDVLSDNNANEDDGLGVDTGVDMDNLLRACLYPTQEDPYGAPIAESGDFRKLIEDSTTPLYTGCKDYSKLSFIIELYQIKSRGKMSDKTFSDTLQLLKKAFPHINIPDSFYETTKLIEKLGCGYKKIDACENDCMLFWKDDNKLDVCKVCNASRWKESSSSNLGRKRVPKKIPWGLPECEETKKWFNETARSRWSDFKTRKLKPYFDFAKGDLVKAKANCPKFIDPPTWEKLCDHFSKINDTGIDMSGKSKSQKCKDAPKANKMNHCLGRTSLIKWKDKHIDELGKPPNVAQTFDKAYLRIDPLEHHGSSNSNQDVESDPWTGITNNPEVRRVSEELHKFYEKAIVEGNEETNANTQSLLNVFGRSTRLLGHVSSRSNNERSKRASSSNKGEIEMLREKVAEAEKKRKGEKRKRKELESKIGVLMACMQNHGMLPLDDNHSASNSHHTESSEDENIDK